MKQTLEYSAPSFRFNDYLALCKPRVVALMMLTAMITMLLTSSTGLVAWHTFVYGSIGIALAACAGGVLNQLIDQRIDRVMARTQARPLPSGRIKTSNAAIFAAILAISSMLILFFLVNSMTAILSLLTLIGYAGIYTLFLKRATPQNIVIGGLAGAMPPLLGASAVSGHIDGTALLLVLIIFAWTPPHFWALAIARHKEYAQAKIPMLPVTHGIQFTKLNILLYTLLLIGVTYLPFIVDMSGLIYLIGISLLNLAFLYQVIRLYRQKDTKYAYASFRYSIFYLASTFLLLLVDHYFPILT